MSHTAFAAPDGVWPVMLTPFHDDGSIDWPALDALTDWYLGGGVAGLFSVCLSSEMYALSNEERLAVARAVARRAAGRVPVIASGTFGGPMADQADFVCRLADTGVDAVVVLTCQLAGAEEPDAVWQRNAEQLLRLTRNVPLGLYECPTPYKRLVSLDLLRWAADTGRFHFLKDTCCESTRLAARCEAVRGSRLKVFNANTPTLLGSLRAGCAGYSGIAANYVPHLYVWLCAHFATEPERAERLQRFLSVADATFHHSYPARAKRYLRSIGLPMSPMCRTGNPAWSEHDQLVNDDLWQVVMADLSAAISPGDE